jgi:hypothetical protein
LATEFAGMKTLLWLTTAGHSRNGNLKNLRGVPSPTASWYQCEAEGNGRSNDFESHHSEGFVSVMRHFFIILAYFSMEYLVQLMTLKTGSERRSESGYFLKDRKIFGTLDDEDISSTQRFAPSSGDMDQHDKIS